jgi:acetyl-CoA carboxylase biotin carboxyl carrier protein
MDQEGKGEVAVLEIDEIIRLIDTVAKKNIAEFELEKGGMRLRIAKKARSSDSSNPAARVSHNNYEKPEITAEMETLSEGREERPVSGLKSLESGPPASKTEALKQELHYLASPIVGTFYRAANPNAEPYVKVGDKVKKGTPVCIVEAMKLMNEIEADVDGEVVEICAENGSPVEYGEPLFGFLPTGGASVN